MTIRDLTVDSENFCIRFLRESTKTRYEVLAGNASMVERRSFGDACEPMVR